MVRQFCFLFVIYISVCFFEWQVFESLIGKELKMSAEEIENALINPNASLAKLHIALLQV